MRLKINGKPIVHHHNCSPNRHGHKMTLQELHDFAVEALIDEYKRADYKEVVRHSEDFNSGADFSFRDLGTTICGKVVYAQDYKINLKNIDVTLLYSNYRKGNIVPRLYLASAYCTSSKDGALVCGGDYIFQFHAETVMLDEVNPELDEILSHTELVQKYIELWETGDTSIVLKYFHKNFRCYPVNCFNPSVSRKEYLLFFAENSRLSNHLKAFTMCLCKSTKTGEIGILVKCSNSEQNYIVSLKTEDGRIKRSWTHKATPEFIEYSPQQVLYQSHGDHISAIMPTSEFIKDLLPKLIHDSILYREIVINGQKIFSLRYVAGGYDFLTLFEQKAGDDSSEFVSAYPYLPGNTITVEIDSVLEWDNQLEATILCHVNDFRFAFFATDYYANRELYVANSIVNVNMSAIGIKVRPGEEGFSFEGQQALDFLVKIGKQPEINAKGEVEPINFSLKELVAFLNKDVKCPDEAEFQSPMSNIEQLSILGVRFNKADIFINRDNDVVIPIYFSEAQLGAPSINHPLSGWLWLMGRTQLSKDDNVIEELCSIGIKFRNAIRAYDFKNFNELNFLLKPLEGVSLPADFDLDAISIGDNFGSYMRLYATRNKREFKPQINSKGEVTNIMEEDMYLCGTVPNNVAKAIPPLEDFLIVSNTNAGIWSAFLLSVSYHILPLVRHAVNFAFDYIFSLEDVDRIYDVNCSKYRNKDILPLITYSNEDSGVLRISYWSFRSGLVRETYQFAWAHNAVEFNRIKHEVLIEYKSSIIF